MPRATTVTTFDDLPPEMVLGIFDFLSAIDIYNSFFDLNSRLRLLVKRWTEYSRKGLYADILFYSTHHSWYKHLNFENGGNLFFIGPGKGKQTWYMSADQGFHWHFYTSETIKYIADERVGAIVASHPFRLNPFFFHREGKTDSSTDESSTCRGFYGSHIICYKWQSSLKTWLENNYPGYVETVLQIKDSNKIQWKDYDVKAVPIFDGEWTKATTAIRQAADQVWNELRDLHNVNPFNVQK